MDECLERWPEAQVGEYDPRCCRFPKSCSVGIDHRAEEVRIGKYLHFKGDVYEVIANGYDENDIPHVFYRHRMTGTWYTQSVRRFTSEVRPYPGASPRPRFEWMG